MIEPVIPPGATVTDPVAWATAWREGVEWLRTASRVVDAAFPNLDFTRESEEITKAQAQLEWYVWAHFYSQTATISDVREAWKNYYKLFL